MTKKEEKKSELLKENKFLKEIRIVALENTIKKLEEENEDLLDRLSTMTQMYMNVLKHQSTTIRVTDEDNRIILEKGEDGKQHSYWGGNVVLC